MKTKEIIGVVIVAIAILALLKTGLLSDLLSKYQEPSLLEEYDLKFKNNIQIETVLNTTFGELTFNISNENYQSFKNPIFLCTYLSETSVVMAGFEQPVLFAFAPKSERTILIKNPSLVPPEQAQSITCSLKSFEYQNDNLR